MAWTEFDKGDWDGMAGATSFPSGREPLVDYQVTLDGDEGYAVLDAAGLYIESLSPDGDRIKSFHAEGMIAARAVALSPNGFGICTTIQLLDAGLTEEFGS